MNSGALSSQKKVGISLRIFVITTHTTLFYTKFYRKIPFFKEILHMKQFKAKPQDVAVFSQVSEGFTLVDKRRGMAGLVIGVIPDIARQYGVKAVKKDDGFIFFGTKGKIQILVEKLHFAGVPYWEI